MLLPSWRQVELLVAHGADPCTLDRLGHMPDECARLVQE